MKRMIVILFCLTILASCTIKTNPATPTLAQPAEAVPLKATAAQSTSTPSFAEKLTVDETAVVAADVDTPGHFEFMERISPKVRDRHAVWKYGNPETLVATPNQILAPFGYRLQQNPILSSYSFQLFKGETLVVDEIAWFSVPTVKADGSDFVMVMDLRTGGQLIAVNGTVGKWNAEGFAEEPPVYAGNDLIKAYFEDDNVVVAANDKIVFKTPAVFMVANPIKGLYAWEGHWVLEMDGKVFVDGQSLNESLGCAEIFDWHLIMGQPFYFFVEKEGSKVGVSYAGSMLPNTYDEVPHYQCCEPAAFNPGFSEHMTWFYGLRNGMWYYVEMGIYE